MAQKFRTSFTHKEGFDSALVAQGRVINFNSVKWTVDVVGQFNRKKYFNIQVGSPYLHHSNGEGIYAFPEVGATCMVCIPSDSAAPFVQSFVMAHELVDDAADDAPLGTSSHAQPAKNATDASFAGGRPRVVPGSIWMRTRDGNFVALHRGGVLQLGATELAQRIYVPLRNLIMDISETYEHHSAAGSIVWGIQDGPSVEQFPGQWLHTFRVFANDRYADVKVACGKVFNPMPEPDGGVALAAAEVAQSADSPIIFDVSVSPKGFVAESGEMAGPQTVKQSVFRYVFDRSGNTLLRAEGNVYFQLNKKLTFRVKEDIDIATEAGGQLKAVSGFDIDGGAYTHIKGSIVRLQQGTTPVARIGDIVATTLGGAPIIVTFSPVTIPVKVDTVTGIGVGIMSGPASGTVVTPAPLIGSITTGNNQVLA